MQDVFRGDGFTTDARFGERDVLGDARIKVVADHQHVEMFIDGVDRVGASRICR